ncbi:MAG: hypothetical protein JXK07_06445 [Spirochaetes bacterium]|nr:hypothetical protein [Spirochaetota bacterium]MBN2769578.1 hypothetical protein [Spirochaetota bacterium]
MKFKMLLFLAFFSLSTAIFASFPPEEDVTKARLTLSKYRWVQMHYFLQTGYSMDFNESETYKSFYMGHNRLIFNGQTSEKMFFLFQTDDFVKKDSIDSTNGFYTSDAFLHYKAHEAVQIYAGKMVAPVSRNALLSPATTVGISANHDALPSYNYTPEGRDTGILIRGFLLNNLIEYRSGFFQGLGNKSFQYEDEGKEYTRNESSIPRITTRFQFNFIDTEEGYFYSENYLRKKNILALGLAFDYQPEVCDHNENGTFDDYFAVSSDISIQTDWRSANSFGFDLAFFYSKNNPNADIRYENLDYTDEIGFYAQAAMLAANVFQAFARFNYSSALGADDGNDFTFTKLSLGGNYFIDDHHAKATIQLDIPVGDSKSMDGEQKLSLQFQAYL